MYGEYKQHQLNDRVKNWKSSTQACNKCVIEWETTTRYWKWSIHQGSNG